jgi:hypothetical protein
MQNKPNLPYFSAKNEDYTKKQTQTNPIQTQTNPILHQLRNPFFQAFYSLLDLPICSLLGFIIRFCQNGTKVGAVESTERDLIKI